MNGSPGDGLSNAGISPKERLERIETMLEKIDGKLDAKADSALVASLEARVRSLELVGSPSVVRLERELDSVHTNIDKIRGRIYWFGGVVFAIASAIGLVDWFTNQ